MQSALLAAMCCVVVVRKGEAQPDASRRVAENVTWVTSVDNTDVLKMLVSLQGDIILKLINEEQDWTSSPPGIEDAISPEVVTQKITPLQRAAPPGIEDAISPEVETQKITPLQRAAYGGHADIVRLLINSALIDVNERDKDGWTALHMAIRQEHTANMHAVVKVLLQAKGIDVNAADTDGFTPLHSAARRNHIDVLSSLLQSPSIDVNWADKGGWSALRWAAVKNHSESCRILCSAPGIDANIKDGSGWTALHSAAEKNHSEVVSVLTHSCPYIDVSAKDEDAWTPSHLPARKGYLDVIKIMASHPSFDVNARTTEGSTLLLLATEKNQSAVVEWLLTQPGILIDLGEDGISALDYASYKGFTHIANLLISHVPTKPADCKGATCARK